MAVPPDVPAAPVVPPVPLVPDVPVEVEGSEHLIVEPELPVPVPPQAMLLAHAEHAVHWHLTIALKSLAPWGFARWHCVAHAWVVQASRHVKNWPHCELDVAQAVLSASHVLPGPTDASEHSSHESVLGRQLFRNA
jgi:hypothetical protein